MAGVFFIYTVKNHIADDLTREKLNRQKEVLTNLVPSAMAMELENAISEALGKINPIIRPESQWWLALPWRAIDQSYRKACQRAISTLIDRKLLFISDRIYLDSILRSISPHRSSFNECRSGSCRRANHPLVAHLDFGNATKGMAASTVRSGRVGGSPLGLFDVSCLMLTKTLGDLPNGIWIQCAGDTIRIPERFPRTWCPVFRMIQGSIELGMRRVDIGNPGFGSPIGYEL